MREARPWVTQGARSVTLADPGCKVPRVSCILISHDKPELCHEAVQSVVDQSHPDWECLILDSGVLFDDGYFASQPWSSDPRLTILRSDESDEIRRTKAMAPWCFNECFRRGHVRGDLVMYLCDDDILYPTAFETFVSFFTQHPEYFAAYASQDIGVIHGNGWRSVIGERWATRVAGKCCNGRPLDCQVDYLQFCHRRTLLDRFEGDEWWPEAKETESHADGIFLERCGSLTPIYPVDRKVSMNRRTFSSKYCRVK